jgi:hypothetical protein
VCWPCAVSILGGLAASSEAVAGCGAGYEALRAGRRRCEPDAREAPRCRVPWARPWPCFLPWMSPPPRCREPRRGEPCQRAAAADTSVSRVAASKGAASGSKTAARDGSFSVSGRGVVRRATPWPGSP